MQVGIVKTGHGEVAAEIDKLRLRALVLVHVEGLADGEDAVSLHRNRFFTINRSEGSVSRNAGVDVGMHEDDVGLRLGVGGRGGVLPPTGCRKKRNKHSPPQTCLACQTHSPTPASVSMVSRIRLRPS